MSDDAKVMIGFGAAIIVVITMIVGINYLLEKARCNARWEAKFQPKYEFFSGCMINVDGQRIPDKNYRVL